MPRFRVVLIEPLNDGNIGAVARSMKNFGLDELYLVRPCKIGEEATKRAMHGIDVLARARTVQSEDEALAGIEFVAATSGVKTANEKNFKRIAMSPKEFAEKLEGKDATVALLFGREDFGLDKEMIKRCDFLVTIPANPSYSILNISHAAAILFYELHTKGVVGWEPRKSGAVEMGKLNEYFGLLLDAIDYPEHKKEKTRVMFRRLIARSVPSTWEFHTLMGVLDGAIEKSSKKRLGTKKAKKKGKRPSKLR